MSSDPAKVEDFPLYCLHYLFGRKRFRKNDLQDRKKVLLKVAYHHDEGQQIKQRLSIIDVACCCDDGC